MSWITRVRFSNVLKQLSYKSNIRINFLHTQSVIPVFISNKTVNFTNHNLDIVRCKHNKKSQKQDLTETDEDDADDNFEDEIKDKQTKLMTVKVNSLRADVILKAGLNIARNKIEVMFYESKIRVNGKKILKKSAMLNVGDEIDIVKGASVQNPDFLTVARVEILSASERGDGLSVKLRRNKSLTIENYDT